MIYPSNFEEKIGFTQLRRYLSEKCISPLGVRKCEAMSFLTNFEKVKCRLLQTNEMLQILRNDNELPIDMIEIDLKNCFDTLGEIIGESYSDEIIDNLFEKFCVGK